MILWEKSDCSPDWTELLSVLADLTKLTEKCSKNCGLLPKFLRKRMVEPDKPFSNVIPKALLECINVLDRKHPTAFGKKTRRDSYL